MFWKKEKEESDAILCSGCGTEITEENAVLDPERGNFICRGCKNLGFQRMVVGESGEINNQENEPRHSIVEEDSYSGKESDKQQKGTTEDDFSSSKVKYTCSNCNYEFPYEKERNHPPYCSYCGERVK